jgi:fructose transport system substrate-binding protein
MRQSARAAAGLVACAVAAATSLSGCGPDNRAVAGGTEDPEVKVGLIVKTETNPFFVTMKQGAQAMATAQGATLMTAAGTYHGDNATQARAIERMTAAGVQGILITPSDSKAIVPSIKKAQEAGVLVIALDTPTEPPSATDALFATDNFKAGELIGRYARAAKGAGPAKVAMLEAAPSSAAGTLRHDGFLKGFGAAEGDASIVCSRITYGDRSRGQAAMEDCLRQAPDLDVAFTVNEPTAFGAHSALKAGGRDKDVLVVSVDGGCAGVEAVEKGQIAATSQQNPLKMAEMGVMAVVEYAQSGTKVSGYTDTGVKLITDRPVRGVESKDSFFGRMRCWG